jgi:hypothetical protein
LNASNVTYINVSIPRLNGADVNLVIGILQLKDETTVGLAPGQPVSSMYVPLLALNLIAYLVTG